MHKETHYLAKMARAASLSRHDSTGGLSPDLLRQSANRLGAVCLIYAVAFFLANYLGIFLQGRIEEELSSFGEYGPGVISITVALIVFALTRSRRVPLTSLMVFGLAFEIAGSFGIAFAEFWGVWDDKDVLASEAYFLGLSWVSAWVICFTVVVPNPPRRSLAAVLASMAAVPITVALTMKYGGTRLVISSGQFFSGLVLPYLIVAGMAYSAARIVYQLGTDVRRAREMGSYRLETLIGRGGMGEVWRAHHLMLARPAAVKLIRKEQLGTGDLATVETMLRRFEQEAQNTAALRSPHTISVYDYGQSDEGSFYYVMELLDGFDLDTLVTRHGPLPASRVIHVLQQACHSLQEAHNAGLVHRDIKPANLFVCRYGDDLDFVKVLDFGLVTDRKTGAVEDDETVGKLTREGAIIGSPAFMAPEMLLADGRVDGRTDLYSLGCVAYWLLTGSLVFKAETQMAMLVMHARDTPVLLSATSETDIPESLEQIVMACLEKDPEKRPQSARELSERLGEVDVGEMWTDAHRARWWQVHWPGHSVPQSTQNGGSIG